MRVDSRPAHPASRWFLLATFLLLVSCGIPSARAAEGVPLEPQTGTLWTTDLDGNSETGLNDLSLFVCGYLTRGICTSSGNPPVPNCWCNTSLSSFNQLDFDCVGEPASLADFAIMARAFLTGTTASGKCP